MTMDRSDHYDPMELAHADCISTVKRWIERRRVIQLKGLNSEFEGRCATMFHQPTLPTLEEAIAYEAPIRQKLPCPRIIRRRYVRYASDTRIPGIPDFPNLKKKIRYAAGTAAIRRGHGKSPDPNKTLTPSALCRPFVLLAGQPPPPPGVTQAAASRNRAAAGRNRAAAGRNRDSLAWIRPSPSPTVARSKVPACSIFSRLDLLPACCCRCVLACLAAPH
jgi:hypothetical protein